MKTKIRMLSFALAILTVVPLIGFSALAEDGATGAWYTFDDGSYRISTDEQLANGTAMYYSMSDGKCAFKHYGGDYGNVAVLENCYHRSYDVSPELSYADNGGKFTASADYFINVPYEGVSTEPVKEPLKFGIRSTGGVTFESSSTTVTRAGSPAFAYIASGGNLDYRLYLDTSKSDGWMNSNEQIEYAGDAEYIDLPYNEWFSLVISLDLVSGVYTLTYRDADTLTVLGSAKPIASYYDEGWKYATDLRNITLAANTFAMGYVLNAGFAEENCGKTSVYMDNVRIGYTPSYEIEVDGKPYPVGVGGIVDLRQPGKQLAWATLTYPNGSTEFTSDPVTRVEENVTIKTQYINLTTDQGTTARLVSPEGLRFTTRLSEKDYEKLATGECVESLRFGTLIAPWDVLIWKSAFTKEAMGNAPYLDVKATEGQWYSQKDGVITFAGSIAGIKEENWNRKFAGVGYIEISFVNGQKSIIYAQTNKDLLTVGTIASASTYAIKNQTLTEQQLTMLKKYADVDWEVQVENMKNDLRGLNVLAIGPSEFSASAFATMDDVWVNKIARECNWNLTNMGVGGMTISWSADNRPGGPAGWVKPSMYDYYFQRKEETDYRWGSQSSEFASVGNPSGNAEDVDYILMIGGNNDYASREIAPRGEWGEKTPGTFFGAWQLTVDAMMEEYPNAKFIFLTIWEYEGDPDRAEWVNRGVEYLYEQYAADPEIGDRFFFIDSGKPEVSGHHMGDEFWRSQFAGDYWHLNEKGMQIIADNMLPHLWEIMRTEDD